MLSLRGKMQPQKFNSYAIGFYKLSFLQAIDELSIDKFIAKW